MDPSTVLLVKMHHKFASSGLPNWALFKNILAAKCNCLLWTERLGFHFKFPEPCIPRQSFPYQLFAHYPPTTLWCCAICFTPQRSLYHGNLPIRFCECSNRAVPLSINPHISIAKSFLKFLPSDELIYRHVSPLYQTLLLPHDKVPAIFIWLSHHSPNPDLYKIIYNPLANSPPLFLAKVHSFSHWVKNDSEYHSG